MNHNELILRKIQKTDCDILFEWINDADTRRNSFSGDLITYSDHVRWFNNALKNQSIIQYISEYNKEPMGVIRVNIDNRVGIVSINIAPDYRGHGYGNIILEQFNKVMALKNADIDKLRGLVKQENISSQRIFENNHYKKIKVEDNCIVYELNLKEYNL